MKNIINVVLVLKVQIKEWKWLHACNLQPKGVRTMIVPNPDETNALVSAEEKIKL